MQCTHGKALFHHCAFDSYISLGEGHKKGPSCEGKIFSYFHICSAWQFLASCYERGAKIESMLCYTFQQGVIFWYPPPNDYRLLPLLIGMYDLTPHTNP